MAWMAVSENFVRARMGPVPDPFGDRGDPDDSRGAGASDGMRRHGNAFACGDCVRDRLPDRKENRLSAENFTTKHKGPALSRSRPLAFLC